MKLLPLNKPLSVLWHVLKARTKLLIPIRSIERESTHMVITRAMFYFYQILTITRLDKSALKSYIKQEES